MSDGLNDYVPMHAHDVSKPAAPDSRPVEGHVGELASECPTCQKDLQREREEWKQQTAAPQPAASKGAQAERIHDLVMEIFDWVDWPGDSNEARRAEESILALLDGAALQQPAEGTK